MAETIGELAVALTGRLDQLQATLNQAKEEVAKFGADQDEVNKRSEVGWGKLAAAAIGAYASIKAAALGAVYATEGWAKSIDNLRTVTGMEEKQASLLVAQLNHFGIDAQAAAFAAFQLSSRAENGSESFAKLGISARDANGQVKAGGLLFLEVIEALRNETSETTRNAIAKDLLGRSAIHLADFIRADKEEIDKINTSAQAMGLIFDKQAVDAYVHLGREVNDIKAAMGGLFRVVADELLPALRQHIDTLLNIIAVTIEWTREHKDLVVGVVQFISSLTVLLGLIAGGVKIFQLISGAITILSTVMAALSATLVTATVSIAGFTAPVWLAVLGALALYEAVGFLIKGTTGLDFTITGLVTRVAGWVKGLTEIKAGHEAAIPPIKKHGDALEELSRKELHFISEFAKVRELDRLAFEADLAIKLKDLESQGVKSVDIELFKLASINKYNKDYKAKADQDEKSRLDTELTGIKKSIQYEQMNYQQKLAFLASYTEAYRGSVQDKVKLDQEYRDLSMEADKARRDELWGSLNSIRDKFADTFTGAIMGTKTVEQAFQDLGTYLIEDFTKTILEMIIQKLIELALIALGLQSMLGVASGGATLPTMLSGIASIKGHAEGGIAMKPTLGIIGEGGEPEAIVPLSKLKDMLGSGGQGGITIENFTFEHKPTTSFGSPGEMRRAAMQIRWALQRVGT